MKLQDIWIPTCIMILLDSIYIYINKDLFSKQVAAVQRVALELRPLGAIVCYIALIFGLYYFILKNKKPVFDAFLLGLVIYAVYDSTTYALLKKWDIHVALMDMLWGGILFAITTWATYKIRES